MIEQLQRQINNNNNYNDSNLEPTNNDDDDEKLRAIVIKANGEKVFSSGHDLKELVRIIIIITYSCAKIKIVPKVAQNYPITNSKLHFSVKVYYTNEIVYAMFMCVCVCVN